ANRAWGKAQIEGGAEPNGRVISAATGRAESLGAQLQQSYRLEEIEQVGLVEQPLLETPCATPARIGHVRSLARHVRLITGFRPGYCTWRPPRRDPGVASFFR